MISIIIPTYNNLDYLKICLNSIKKNSIYSHEIILHINEGVDGTLKFAEDNNIKFTYSKKNNGICIGCNQAVRISTNDLLLYAHDDMYFCPDWDLFFSKELAKIKLNDFFLSGTMVQPFESYINLNCGLTYDNFNEKKLLAELPSIIFDDFQGTHWQPSLIPLKTWRKVGGFSEEFYPGTGSDPDLNMKLWLEGVRIFKGLNDCKVYHFGSIVTRQKEKNFNTVTETGSKGSKLFLLKWGISIKFFKNHFLRSGTKYTGPLDEPLKNLRYYFELFLCKIYKFYLKIFFKS